MSLPRALIALAGAAPWLSPSLAAQTPELDSIGRYVGVRRFLLPAARNELSQALEKAGSWTALGCDEVGGRKIRQLGADVARICYARAIGDTDPIVTTVYYTDDWRAAYFDLDYY